MVADRARPRAGEPLQRAEDGSGGAARRPQMLVGALADLLDIRTDAAGPESAGRIGSPPEFTDAAASAGLRFVHDNGHIRRNPPPPEAMCGGVGLLDFDGDGWLDVYVVQGGRSRRPLPGMTATACSAIAATARLKMSRRAPGSPRFPAATAMA